MNHSELLVLTHYLCCLFPLLSDLHAAGLRRSFRLSRKDRQGSSGEGSDSGDSDFLTYEEVTRYQQRSNERPRLVVLIGKIDRIKTEIMLKYCSSCNVEFAKVIFIFVLCL